jgi:lipopolysaccharide transport system ATP-binding protein
MTAIAVREVHKAFHLPHERRTTLTERVLGMLRPATYERFEALRGIDLTVERGDFVGIIGNNGSGKSTLLKIIAGLLVADAGAVHVEGTMCALLELGLGFSPELTVCENVELYGAILGYPRDQMSERIETAIQFAELGRFRDAKLKNLSTGMQVRLAFATALQAGSDILLLDEILAVGDAAFQSKCFDVFGELRQRGTTVLLVSHNLAHIRRFCDRAVLLDAGQVVAAGDPGGVIARYLSGATPASSGPAQSPSVHATRLHLREAWLENAAAQRLEGVQSGERPTVVLRFAATEDIETPVCGIAIRDDRGAYVYAVNTQWLGRRTGMMHAHDVIEVRVPFVAALRNGSYAVDAAVTDQTGGVFHDWVHGALSFGVSGSLCQDGLVDLQADFTWRVLPQAAERATPGAGRLVRSGAVR